MTGYDARRGTADARAGCSKPIFPSAAAPNPKRKHPRDNVSGATTLVVAPSRSAREHRATQSTTAGSRYAYLGARPAYAGCLTKPATGSNARVVGWSCGDNSVDHSRPCQGADSGRACRHQYFELCPRRILRSGWRKSRLEFRPLARPPNPSTSVDHHQRRDPPRLSTRSAPESKCSATACLSKRQRLGIRRGNYPAPMHPAGTRVQARARMLSRSPG